MAVVIFAYNAVNEHSHIASTQHSANLPTRLMKSRHESHHRHCLLSPFTCFQFLLLFSFFLLFFHQLIPVLNFIHRYGPSQDIQHTKKSSDASYMRFNLYSNLPLLPTQQPQTTKSRKNARKTQPHRCVTIIVVIFCFVPSIGPFAFCSWPFLVLREFLQRNAKKKFKKIRPNRVKLTRKPSEGGGGNKGKKIDAEICALRNKKKAVCVYSSTQTLCERSRRLIPRSLLVCPAKRGKNARRRWKKNEMKNIFYCCGLFQAHQQRLLLPRLCKKPLHNGHTSICLRKLFAFISKRKAGNEICRKVEKKNVAAQVEHWFDSGGRKTELSLLRNFHTLFSGKDQDQMWDIDLTRMLLIVKRLMDDKSVNRSIECFVEFRFQWKICCIKYSYNALFKT